MFKLQLLRHEMGKIIELTLFHVNKPLRTYTIEAISSVMLIDTEHHISSNLNIDYKWFGIQALLLLLILFNLFNFYFYFHGGGSSYQLLSFGVHFKPLAPD